MPRYRLTAGHGIDAECFDAVDDAQAIGCARVLASGMQSVAREAAARDGFRIERECEGGDWQFLFLWVPDGPRPEDRSPWRWR